MWNLLFRLGLALVSGALIGWERHASGKPAGLRTYMLVSVGAAIFVMAALIYLAITLVITRCFKFLEHVLSKHRRPMTSGAAVSGRIRHAD